MHTIIGIGFFGGTELLIVFGITLVLFGGTKLPQLGQGLGEAIRNFKKGVESSNEEASEGEAATPALQQPASPPAKGGEGAATEKEAEKA